MSAPKPAPQNGALRILMLWVAPLVVTAAAIYLYGSAGRYVETDNAYIQRDRIDVAAQLAGDVRDVYVRENEQVKAGQPILALDDAIAHIAVRAAESRLATARAEILGAQASYREKSGEMAVARRAAEYAERDTQRQDELAARKLVPAATVDNSHRTADIAKGSIAVLELQRAQLAARLGGRPDAPVDTYPSVQVALAELERSHIDLARTRLYAPADGIASHVPKIGARLDVGRPAVAIVASGRLWIDANFKETDLEWVHPGNPVHIVIDTYPSHTWTGRVESIAGATGSEFALLPAQNASGNWVKVVQRIPVRIAVEQKPDDPPLRDGMSADVQIDTGPHTRFDRWFGKAR
jgi:membrane fusion protein (multidrug efflux system)